MASRRISPQSHDLAVVESTFWFPDGHVFFFLFPYAMQVQAPAKQTQAMQPYASICKHMQANANASNADAHANTNAISSNQARNKMPASQPAGQQAGNRASNQASKQARTHARAHAHTRARQQAIHTNFQRTKTVALCKGGSPHRLRSLPLCGGTEWNSQWTRREECSEPSPTIQALDTKLEEVQAPHASYTWVTLW